MTYGAFPQRYSAPLARHRRFRVSGPHVLICATALLLGTSCGVLLLRWQPPAVQATLDVPAAGGPEVATIDAPPQAPPVDGATLFDPTFATPDAPPSFGRSLPLAARFELSGAPATAVDPAGGAALELRTADAESASFATAPPAPPVNVALTTPEEDSIPLPPLRPLPDQAEEAIPLPLPRPALLPPVAAARPPAARPTPIRVARQAPTTTAPAAPSQAPASPGFFDRLFGRAQSSGPALAYAAAESDGIGFGGASRTITPDRWTAVYNIAAHTVTLPDGTRLEAHSGLGPYKDDPRSVAEHMRGATPPAVYELQPRETLFHGVPALRLNPVGGTTYGRGGLLAHTYMLGPRGDSNGCVVFRNYYAFRQAFDAGMVKRLIVVAGRG
jgi:hypothetical protein